MLESLSRKSTVVLQDIIKHKERGNERGNKWHHKAMHLSLKTSVDYEKHYGHFKYIKHLNTFTELLFISML